MTVIKYRKEIEDDPTYEFHKLDKLEGADGRKYPAEQKKKPKTVSTQTKNI